MFRAFFLSLFDFLYPKEVEVLALEALAPHERVFRYGPLEDRQLGEAQLEAAHRRRTARPELR